MIFSGFGGQGLMTLGKFVAEILMHRYQVTFFPSYGTEVRGGTANCHVCASDRPIASPTVESATCLVVMNQMSYDRFAPVVRPDGLVLSNASMVKPTAAHGAATTFSASLRLTVSGFSQRMCLPASAALIVHSACSGCGVAMKTASTPSSANNAS